MRTSELHEGQPTLASLAPSGANATLFANQPRVLPQPNAVSDASALQELVQALVRRDAVCGQLN